MELKVQGWPFFGKKDVEMIITLLFYLFRQKNSGCNAEEAATSAYLDILSLLFAFRNSMQF